MDWQQETEMKLKRAVAMRMTGGTTGDVNSEIAALAQAMGADPGAASWMAEQEIRAAGGAKAWLEAHPEG